MRKSKLKLGEILIKEGLINQSQLDESLKLQRLTGRPIGDILVDKGFIGEKRLAHMLAKQLDIPFVSFKDGTMAPSKEDDLDKLVLDIFARQHLVLPLAKHLKSLTVALADPLDLLTLDNLKKITGCEINPVMATRSDLRDAIDVFYGQKNLLQKIVDDSYTVDGETPVYIKEVEESLEDLVAKAEDAPVVKLVDLILIQAVKERASDIHIEPYKDKINVRFRIDGELQTIAPPSQHLLLALISRIKILSKMDIAEKRLPQDGGFTVRIQDRNIDLRVSIIPTVFGEKAVLRILDKGATSLDIDKLGFAEDDLKRFKECVMQPYGLVFVTGPTGSGKSTTLYSALNYVSSPKKNILTIEDPVEYQLSGINQVQIKAHIGLTFAAGLRAFLRQDPDIIMVGEVRDAETAEICVRAALTGHLVFSTLHTNDAPSAINRLIDIGVEGFLVANSVILIMAQRLVRKLCQNCKEPDKLLPEIIKKYNMSKDTVFKAKGCEKCRMTGYSGRLAIHELLVINQEVRELIVKAASTTEIADAGKRNGMKPLIEDGIRNVEEGITSLEEVVSTVFV